ncbi:MAG TPA: hypothetical protein VGD14_19905 [bacterium]
MSENKFKLLKADIQFELENLNKLVVELEALTASLNGTPGFTELRAMGSILHDFYCGVEKIFERIAFAIDGEIPQGSDWHSQLLVRMGSEIEGIRPAVVNKVLQNQLREYLRFRHLFRNVYGFAIEWSKLQRPVNLMPEIYNNFQTELTHFFNFLDAVGENM